MNFDEQFREEIKQFYLEAIEPDTENGTVGSIRPKVRAAILAKLAAQIGQLLLNFQEEIFEEYKRAYFEHSSGGQFAFPLSIRAAILPYGVGYKIKAASSFSTKHHADIVGTIGDDGGTEDMFGNNEVTSMTLSSTSPGRETKSVTITSETAKKAAAFLKESVKRTEPPAL